MNCDIITALIGCAQSVSINIFTIPGTTKTQANETVKKIRQALPSGYEESDSVNIPGRKTSGIISISIRRKP